MKTEALLKTVKHQVSRFILSNSIQNLTTKFRLYQRNLLEYVPNWTKHVPFICIHCDRQLVIRRAQSKMYNSKSRYIYRRHKTVRKLPLNGVITIDYVKSKDIIVDLLIKGLNREQVEKSSKEKGLKPEN